MRVSRAIWGGIECTCHAFCSRMGIESYIYIDESGTVLGGEIIDGEWTILDADDAADWYEHLARE